ncbi:MAG TPA: hypothetical protein VE174_08095 [Actinomycetota bacterium]|nr:hypothetical protein [Actinomycetota bacterium]
MRTILAGIGVFQRAPAAVAPLTLQGICVGGLIATNVLPARAPSVPAGSVFPLDVYFDVKHWLAFATGWPALCALVIVSVLVRAAVLGATLTLADERPLMNAKLFLGCLRLAALAALAFFPVAVLFFSGAAIRYAPFIWVAAPIGFGVAISFCRRGIKLDTGAGPPATPGLPEVASFMSYVVVIAVAGAAVSALGGQSRLLVAIFVACLGPIHALFLLGWRENARLGTYPGGGAIAVAMTVSLVGILVASTVYDRYLTTPPPVAQARSPGSLLLLGGSDSTSTTGALHDLDFRSIGYTRARTRHLSYLSGGNPYGRSDTHEDLDEIARIVAAQIRRVDGSTRILGHSQAALIVDRMPEQGSSTSDAVAIFAPSPPKPPSLDVPGPGRSGVGRAAGDSARALASLLRAVGMSGFDIDAPAAPVHLQEVTAGSDVPRMGIWAVADSVWLDQDWRRPDELNLLAITDHVGVTKNGRSLELVGQFFEGRSLEGDETSWRSVLVPVVRYAFEPWRPW